MDPKWTKKLGQALFKSVEIKIDIDCIYCVKCGRMQRHGSTIPNAGTECLFDDCDSKEFCIGKDHIRDSYDGKWLSMWEKFIKHQNE